MPLNISTLFNKFVFVLCSYSPTTFRVFPILTPPYITSSNVVLADMISLISSSQEVFASTKLLAPFYLISWLSRSTYLRILVGYLLLISEVCDIIYPDINIFLRYSFWLSWDTTCTPKSISRHCFIFDIFHIYSIVHMSLEMCFGSLFSVWVFFPLVTEFVCYCSIFLPIAPLVYKIMQN